MASGTHLPRRTGSYYGSSHSTFDLLVGVLSVVRWAASGSGWRSRWRRPDVVGQPVAAVLVSRQIFLTFVGRQASLTIMGTELGEGKRLVEAATDPDPEVGIAAVVALR